MRLAPFRVTLGASSPVDECGSCGGERVTLRHLGIRCCAAYRERFDGLHLHRVCRGCGEEAITPLARMGQEAA